MPVFADKHGHEWRAEVDFGVVLDWKAECNLDLGDAEKSLDRLNRAIAIDPFSLAELVWIACREKAQEMKLTRDEFIRRLPADTDTLRGVLMEGVLLFFHGKRTGSELIPQLRKLLQGESTLNGSATNSPESAELNQPD